MVDTKKLKNEILKILEKKDVKHVICYTAGSYGFQTRPFFISKKEDIEKIIFSPLCLHNLSLYVNNNDEKKIGVVVKGCDSKSVVQLIQEKQLDRKKIIIIGIPCKGVIDPKKLREKISEPLEQVDVKEIKDKYIITFKDKKHEFNKKDLVFDKCLTCEHPTPIIYDVLIDEKIKPTGKEKYEQVKTFEKQTIDNKWKFWEEQFSKCIRCYACRNVCPICFCEECMAEQLNPQWLYRSVNISENTIWHIMRAFHLAGRCTGCGECERVCPMDIPLMLLNKKLEKEIKELYDYIPGTNPENIPLFAMYKPDDPGGDIK